MLRRERYKNIMHSTEASEQSVKGMYGTNDYLKVDLQSNFPAHYKTMQESTKLLKDLQDLRDSSDDHSKKIEEEREKINLQQNAMKPEWDRIKTEKGKLLERRKCIREERKAFQRQRNEVLEEMEKIKYDRKILNAETEGLELEQARYTEESNDCKESADELEKRRLEMKEKEESFNMLLSQKDQITEAADIIVQAVDVSRHEMTNLCQTFQAEVRGSKDVADITEAGDSKDFRSHWAHHAMRATAMALLVFMGIMISKVFSAENGIANLISDETGILQRVSKVIIDIITRWFGKFDA